MKRIWLILALCLFLGGCTTYYRVTDPTTDTNYYTTAVKQKSGGAVSFKDSRTGSAVTLQSSKITKITKEEFTYGDPYVRSARGQDPQQPAKDKQD